MTPIAPEAYPILFGLAVWAAAVQWLGGLWVALPWWLILLTTTAYFRMMPREIPAAPAGILSPVDGRVLSIDANVYDPYLNRSVSLLTIKQHVLGECSLLSPIEGKLMRRWLPSEGADLADSDDALKQVAMWLRSDYDEDIVVTIDVTHQPHYVRCEKFTGERLGQGERCGFMGLGRRVGLYLPEQVRPRIAVGQNVRAGVDMIAELIRD